MTTVTTKLGRELAVGDAIVFLGEGRVITALDDHQHGQRKASTAGGGYFVVPDDKVVEVDDATPGPYDGYMSAVPEGWHVVSEQVEHGTFTDEAVAATVLAKTSKRPRWKVHLDGYTVRLG